MTPDELEEFLKGRPEENRHQEVIWIASRAAARVMPFAIQDGPGSLDFDLTVLPILRCLVISRIATNVPTREIKEFARAAATLSALSAEIAAPAGFSLAILSHVALTAARGAAALADADEAADPVIRAVATFAVALSDAVAAGVFADAALIESGAWQTAPLPLWPDTEASDATQLWKQVKPKLPRPGVGYGPDTARGEPNDDWGFWIDWYDSWLEGKPFDLELQKKVALIPDEDWEHEGNPGHINLIIREMYQQSRTAPLSNASIVDFAPDPSNRWMEIRPIVSDLDHLSSPELVTAFVSACANLREQFQDFLDFAREEARARPNQSAPSIVAVDKILRELDRAENPERLRAAWLIDMGHRAELEIARSEQRQVVGEDNAKMLDQCLDDFFGHCRNFLLPGQARLGVLRTFDLDGHDPEDLIAGIDKALATLRDTKRSGLLPPDAETEAAFDDFRDGLENLRTQILEADTDERRRYLGKRFAERYAGVVATIKRYVEKAAPLAEKGTGLADDLIKNYGRWTKLAQLADWISKFF